MANTIAELLQKVTDKILVGGRRTTATNSKDVYNSIIESNLNLKDGGFVVESETGYTTEITPTDNKSFATKKYVDENGGGGTQDLESVLNQGNVSTTTIETTGFVKTGGTSSQFLKANGSIDSSNYLEENTAITGATKTKITYDSKGLVTSGTDATTADINDSTNRRYVTDANLTIIGNTSGTNTGDETQATIETKLGFSSVTSSTIAFFNATKNLISANASNLGAFFQTFTAKSLPIDNDTIIVNDSASSFQSKKTTWLEIKTTLKTYFDSLYAQLTANNTFTAVNMFNATSNPLLTDGRFITNGGNNNIPYNTFNKTPYQVTGSLQFDDAIGHLGGAYSTTASSGALKNRDTFSRRYSATGIEFGARNDGAGTNTLGKPNIVVSYGFYDEVNDNITATPKFRVSKTATTAGASPTAVDWSFDQNPLTGVAKGISCTFADAIRILNNNFTGNSSGQTITNLNGVLTRTSGLNGTQLQMCDGITWRGLLHFKGSTSPSLSTILSTQNAIPKFQNATDLEVVASNLIDDGTTLKYGVNRIELEQNIISQSGVYTITSNNYIILCTSTSSFTLPSTASLIGKTFIIYSNNFPLTINRAGSDLINGSVSASYTGYTKLEVRCLANNVWLTN